MPETEKRGRRHSSEVTVAWFSPGEATTTNPAVPEVPRDEVRIDTFRASGAGGQHRNKTDSGVRITHLPTGIVVTATEERSQHQNRVKAWSRLGERLAELDSDDAHERVNSVRREVLDEFRTWTWCGWRDEVKGPGGRRGSMSRVLTGKLAPLLR